MKSLLLSFILSIFCFSQEIKISGTNRGIQSASVIVLDDAENTSAFTYSKENDNYLNFKKNTIH
jgi:hypothetical protein